MNAIDKNRVLASRFEIKGAIIPVTHNGKSTKFMARIWPISKRNGVPVKFAPARCLFRMSSRNGQWCSRLPEKTGECNRHTNENAVPEPRPTKYCSDVG